MSFEDLSDAELNDLLVKNGIQNLPVTEISRNILINKLKKHLLIKKIHQKETPNNMVHYSNHNIDQSGPIREDFRNVIKTRRNIQNFPHNSVNIERRQPNHIKQSINKSHELPHLINSTAFQMKDSSNMCRSSILCSEYETNSNLCSPNLKLKSSPTLQNSTNLRSNVFARNPHNADFGVVNRLLSFRDTSLHQPRLCPNPSADDIDFIHQKMYTSCNKYNDTKSKKSLSQIIGQFNIKSGLKQMCITNALNVGFLVFFTILILMYMIIRPNINDVVHENNTHFTLCNKATSTPTSPCIENLLLHDAIELNKELLRLLQSRAEIHYCSDRTQSASVSISDFIQARLSTKSIDNDKLLRTFSATTYLIQNNPQWKIGIEEKGVAVNIGTPNIKYKDASFILLKPYLSLKCALQTKIQHFFLLTGTVAIVALITAFCYLTFRYIRNWKINLNATIDNFITEIINELNRSDVVILNHLRDKLIPPKKRGGLLFAWKEAVRLLELNESRIKFGVTTLEGEEFRTMKWTGNGNGSGDIINSKSTKKWQSPAFDSTNKIQNPPTSCLKIRHMFDPSEVHQTDLKQTIKAAILEKVGPACNVTDIQLDLQTCCVYVRCATEKDAGIVHNEINGWWFDKRLLSIKFLRLQRYLSRFPNSLDPEFLPNV